MWPHTATAGMNIHILKLLQHAVDIMSAPKINISVGPMFIVHAVFSVETA